MFQHRINAESFSVSQLCVNTLPATKVTLVTDAILFGKLRVNVSGSYQRQYELSNHVPYIKTLISTFCNLLLHHTVCGPG
jgi:hypothetical protein